MIKRKQAGLLCQRCWVCRSTRGINVSNSPNNYIEFEEQYHKEVISRFIGIIYSTCFSSVMRATIFSAPSKCWVSYIQYLNSHNQLPHFIHLSGTWAPLIEERYDEILIRWLTPADMSSSSFATLEEKKNLHLFRRCVSLEDDYIRNFRSSKYE